MPDETPLHDTYDLAGCEHEPIHIPGSIQPHGALLALDPADLQIVHAGGRTAEFLGASPAGLVGQDARDLFTPAQIQRLRALMHADASHAHPVYAFQITSQHDQAAVDLSVHRASGLVIMEFEPRIADPLDDPLSLLQGLLSDKAETGTVQAFCEAVANQIRALTGFDRVMVYRFMPDLSGEVKAEARGAEVEAFLGLRYPESDIPVQARRLYLSNPVRFIPDARYVPAPIVPVLNPANGQPLDLSQGLLRSVSPVHRQYMVNMGVAASLTLSIVVRGQLWGLVACHHQAPRHLPRCLRAACEVLATLISARMEVRVAAEAFDGELLTKTIHDDLVRRMSQESDLAAGLVRFHPSLLDLIPAGGVALWMEGRFTGLRDTPSAGQTQALVAWLSTTTQEGVFHTDCLPAVYPPAQDFAGVASGLLALAISRTPRDYVLWFRPELPRTVSWGGNPNKPVEVGPSGLEPRASFAAWRESVRLHSEPWRDVEVAAAQRLRLSLLEVVLGRIDQIAQERETARLRQEQLAAALDRRLAELEAVTKDLRQETARRAIAEKELSQVLHRTVQDQEAERLRISRELHDTLGQSLALLQFGLDDILKLAPANTDLRQQVMKLKTLTTEAGRDAGRLAWEIRPAAIDDFGIQAAIENFVETWSERTAIKVDLHLTLKQKRLPSAVETTLYRVLQEAMTNVVRHAEATRVGVILTASEQQVTMIIEDNGRGFLWETDPNRSPGQRLGLLGIRERLALIGGTLEVDSAPGNGATLFIRAPV